MSRKVSTLHAAEQLLQRGGDFGDLAVAGGAAKCAAEPRDWYRAGQGLSDRPAPHRNILSAGEQSSRWRAPASGVSMALRNNAQQRKTRMVKSNQHVRCVILHAVAHPTPYISQHLPGCSRTLLQLNDHPSDSFEIQLLCHSQTIAHYARPFLIGWPPLPLPARSAKG